MSDLISLADRPRLFVVDDFATDPASDTPAEGPAPEASGVVRF